MVGRSVDKKDEIRAYIKARTKLGCSLKKLMTEISTAFGPSCVSYDTVRRWKKKFEFGVESIKNAPKSGRPKSASRKEIVSKIKEIIEGDARFTGRDIARKVGISLSTVHLILKKHLKVRKISARRVPHVLTDEQKRQRVKVAKKLLQMFPKYDKKQFANVVTGDETWVHYFEPVRKVSNKIWATKHSKRPQALASAIHQYLITVPKSAYRDAFKKWIHRLKLCISSHGEYFEGLKWVLLG